MYEHYLLFLDELKEEGTKTNKIYLEISYLCGDYDSDVEDALIELQVNPILLEEEFNRIIVDSFSRYPKDLMGQPRFFVKPFGSGSTYVDE